MSVTMPFSGVDTPEEPFEYPHREGISEEAAAELVAEGANVVDEVEVVAEDPADYDFTDEPVVETTANVAVPKHTGPAVAPGAVQGAPAGTVTPLSPYGTFEGLPIAGTVVKLNGEARVESLSGIVVSMDDRVRLVGEFKCIGVRFEQDKKSGDVVRHMILKASNIEIAPWDPANPLDDGILRARPSQP